MFKLPLHVAAILGVLLVGRSHASLLIPSLEDVLCNAAGEKTDGSREQEREDRESLAQGMDEACGSTDTNYSTSAGGLIALVSQVLAVGAVESVGRMLPLKKARLTQGTREGPLRPPDPSV